MRGVPSHLQHLHRAAPSLALPPHRPLPVSASCLALRPHSPPQVSDPCACVHARVDARTTRVLMLVCKCESAQTCLHVAQRQNEASPAAASPCPVPFSPTRRRLPSHSGRYPCPCGGGASDRRANALACIHKYQMCTFSNLRARQPVNYLYLSYMRLHMHEDTYG